MYNDLIKQINDTMDNSHNSSKRSAQLIRQTLDIGKDSIEELKKQGEQINKINNELDEINNLTDDAQYHLRSIKSIFGSFFNNVIPKWNNRQAINTKKIIPSKKNNNFNNQFIKKKEYDYNYEYDENTFTIEQINTMKQIDKKIEINLFEIEDGVNELKQIALEMREELDTQNIKLNKTNNITDKTNFKIINLNKQIKQLNK